MDFDPRCWHVPAAIKKVLRMQRLQRGDMFHSDRSAYEGWPPRYGQTVQVMQVEGDTLGIRVTDWPDGSTKELEIKALDLCNRVFDGEAI